MKKTILIIILTLSVLFSNIIPTFAVEYESTNPHTEDGYTSILLEDGSILKISPAIIIESNDTSRSTEKKRDAYKVAYIEDSSGNRAWEYTLNATFKYVEGVSAVCDSKYYAYNIYEDGWSLSGASSTASGNVARGVGTFTKKIFFITIKTYEIDISLTCDIYGNVT